MNPGTLNISYNNNDELDKTYAVTDEDGLAVDLSAKDLRWTVKRKKTDDSALILLTTDDGLTVGGDDNNEVTLSGTHNLEGRAYHHDLENTSDNKTIWTGILSVTGDVSRDEDEAPA